MATVRLNLVGPMSFGRIPTVCLLPTFAFSVSQIFIGSPCLLSSSRPLMSTNHLVLLRPQSDAMTSRIRVSGDFGTCLLFSLGSVFRPSLSVLGVRIVFGFRGVPSICSGPFMCLRVDFSLACLFCGSLNIDPEFDDPLRLVALSLSDRVIS